MIYLISNTNFGFKNNNPEWLEIMTNYFQSSMIPFLKKHVNKGDELIHLGNLFYTDNINIDILNQVQSIFETISQILPIKFIVGKKDKTSDNSINSYKIFKGIPQIQIIEKVEIFDNYAIIPNVKNFQKELDKIDKKIIFCHHNILENAFHNSFIINGFYQDFKSSIKYENIGSPYQLRKEDSQKTRGFTVLKSDGTSKLIENNLSPRFEILKMETLEDIIKIDPKFLENNFVDLQINKELMNKHETQIKVILSQYKIQNTEYIESDENIQIFENFDNLDIIKMIQLYIQKEENSKELLSEFEIIISKAKVK